MFLVDHLLTKWLESSRLKVEPQRCVRTRNRFSSCNKCDESCPVSAISFDKGLKVQEDICTECMKCTVNCPSDALYDEKYSQYFKEIPNRELVSFSCENDKNKGSHIKLACLAQLDKTLLIHAINKGKKVTIQFDQQKCMKCMKYDGTLKTHLDETISILNAMLNDSVSIDFNVKSIEGMERSYSRRDLLSFYSKKVTNTVVSPLVYEQEKVKNLREKLESGSKQTIFQRTLNLYQDQFIELQTARNINTAQFVFTENCDGCKVCSNVCTTGALKFIDDDIIMKANFQSSLCNGCMACVDICRKDGIRLNHSPIPLSVFLDKKEEELFNRSYRACPKCGENHINHDSYCEDCSIQQRRYS